MGLRLQKVLAQAGVGSRRASEELVRSGRVRVNGRVAALGAVVDPAVDHIELDGLPLAVAEAHAYLMLNKPPGVLSSLRSQGGRPTVRDLAPQTLRLYPVGRLDLNSEGLILLTNDGALAHALTHPRFGHKKTYRVLLDRRPSESQLEAWQRGLRLEDGTRFGPAQVAVRHAEAEGCWVEVILQEGQKRQIRRSAEALGLKVRRLIRTGFAGLELGSLGSGAWRALSEAEIQRLRGDREPGLQGGRPGPNTHKVGSR